MATIATHRTAIAVNLTGHPTRFHGFCACGWDGRRRIFRTLATLDAFLHRRRQ